jgi:hypothetical protein
MTSYIKMRCRLFGIGTLLILCGIFSQPTFAQCDFINDITGITLGTLPVGDAADPLIYTQTYVLVDNQGNVFATSPTADFLAVSAGFYNLYAINYINTEVAGVAPLITIGQPWYAIEAYGNDDATNCFDYTLPYGTGCPIVVCDEITICEIDTLNNPAFNFNATDHEQNYCLVCNDNVEAIDGGATFPLQDYPAVVAGANCQLFGINYDAVGGNPLSVGDSWTAVTDLLCTNSCLDFIGMNLDITPISQPSGNGISTTADWWSAPCLGAQDPVNGGNDFLEVVNNWCVPSYNPGPISARPTTGGSGMDELQLLMGGREVFSRVPCVGTMDLTQNTIFYTVECAAGGPSQLDVLVSNPGGNITMIEAALYGPVNMPCPGFSGGTFVDCDDAGAGSQSGVPIGNLNLTTNGNPGEVYIVIVDTEGTEQFTISSLSIILSSKLVRFEGKKEEDSNLLEWQVQEETDVDHYELQRSVDAINFASITQATALSNGALINNYSYVDELPGVGSKYYRLKTAKTDGSFEYSNVVVLSRGDDNMGGLAVYPNPTEGTFYVEFASNVKTEIGYNVQDIIGQSVIKGTADVELGLNKLALSLESFPGATYIVSLTMNGQRVQRKLIKQ